MNGSFKKISISAGETITINFSFSPFAQKTDTVVNGKYFDVQTLLTSDITRPYLDINLKAESVD
jgi:ABC-type sulfate transport system substrate-binding protein